MVATAVLIGLTAYRTAVPVVRADGTTGKRPGCDADQSQHPPLVPEFVEPAAATDDRDIAACVGIFAIPGTITHAYLGDIDWTDALALAAGVIPGAHIVRFTIAADERS